MVSIALYGDTNRFVKVFFNILKKEGWFTKSRKADRVAMKYIYTKIMRKELAEFVHVWNHHAVRRQPNRPHVIPGVPNLRYNYAEAQGRPSVGYPIDEQYFLDLQAACSAWGTFVQRIQSLVLNDC